MLAYNCSPSFNWKKKLDDETIAKFQNELGKMGYKFQFITLAGFHSLNFAMFELAKNYQTEQMTAYAKLQEQEFASEIDGYRATKHQSFVGTGYFDATQVISAVHLQHRFQARLKKNIRGIYRKKCRNSFVKVNQVQIR